MLGIDARGGRVASEGWLTTSDVAATELAGWFAGEPIAALMYTDIAADGMMAGPTWRRWRPCGPPWGGRSWPRAA